MFKPTALSLAVAVLAAACATPPGSPAPAGSSPAATPVPPAGAPAAGSATAAARPASAPPAATPPAPGQPQPFATVSKDARRIEGLFPLWQKDDKVWIELAPGDFGKPFFFGPKIAQGIGEPPIYGGMMFGRWGPAGRSQIVEFRRLHNQVQLLARNNGYDAPANTPEGRGVRAGYSPSLLGASPVASQPHPERKTVLVELNPILLSDMQALGLVLQRTYRQNYALDRANSAITQVRNKPGEMVFEVQAHYATAALAFATPGAPPNLPQPTLPRTLPDARSLFLGLHYAFSALPAVPMQPRLADARIGHFTSNVADFSHDNARTPQVRYVNRWRLEKKDPTAELSEPVKPITFWLDRTIPLKYRDAIARGVTGWNAAFEKIGFKNAVVAKVQPDDADFDTLDIGSASIRWMVNAGASFGAIGPSQVDPRSGEILDADIAFESLSSRSIRSLRVQVLGPAGAASWAAQMQLPDAAQALAGADFAARPRLPDAMACDHADFAFDQLGYAMEVLAARGDLDPDSPEADQWVQDYLTDTTLHEVGHTLGLRHNFRSSRAYTNAQMNDPEFVARNGLAGSVMEYAPINLAPPGAKAVPGFQKTLGPYDHWAIEYAYKPMAPGSTREQERAELQRIAARSAEPQLAYGTDEDNSLGIDPESLVFDLGDDPVAYAQQRMAIARDMLQRQGTRELKPEAGYPVLRRAVNWALREIALSGGLLARQIGGVRTLRDQPGSGRDPLQPVDAARQRAALELLSRHLLSADAVTLPAALQRRLAIDFGDRTDAVFSGESPSGTDFSLAGALLDMQRAVVVQLMSDGVAQRLLDSEGKVLAPEQPFRLGDLYGRLARDLWSELDAKTGDIAASRRELQREYASRLSAQLLRPAAQGRADARSLLRQQANELLPRLEAAQRRSGLSAEARAHLLDLSDQLRQALQARLNRAS